tara:strand:+ start:500 stop:1831 length:1332 start_codon:yes stop_codon:yes gene_type:complete
MIIRHYCNSFIEVIFSNKKIVCDPWIGNTNESAWYSWPFYYKSNSFLNQIKPDFIYISHLHCDHFDPKTLGKYKNKNTKIIIKKFKSKRLKNKIKNLGFKNIIELKSWEKKRICDEFNIAIIPQMSSNTSELSDEVNYDLDTSIIIESRISKKIFYNNVDNPLSINELKKVKKYINDNFKSNLSIMCYPLGAASGYPQTFIDLNKSHEKKKIIEKSFEKLGKVLKIFEPEIFFPAGGTYMISGKFNVLNKWIAQPSNGEIKNYFKNKHCKLVNIEGGDCINLNNEFKNIKTSRELGVIKSKFQMNLSKIKYFYQLKKNKKSVNFLNRLFDECQEKYYHRVKLLNVKTNWNIKINIFDDIKLKSNGQIKKSSSGFIKSYVISSQYENRNKKIDLVCNLDKDLFFCLMMKYSPWNTALTGSIILFSRKSKIYNPTIENSLNFFTN